MWGTWFGGSGTQKRKDAPKKAILDLRQQLDMLQKREKHLENQMAEQEKIAKANVSSNKTGKLPTVLRSTQAFPRNESIWPVWERGFRSATCRFGFNIDEQLC